MMTTLTEAAEHTELDAQSDAPFQATRSRAEHPRLSIVIISFNTRDLTRRCIQALRTEVGAIPHEILVVDNASKDGSADMIEAEFPDVRLARSEVNLGFGNANNVALRNVRGEYIILLNSDAFMAEGALARAIANMDNHPRCGLGGAMLVGREGDLQPSARRFHTLFRDFAVMSGLAYKFPKSRLFGALDRTWADPKAAALVDWVPGAFSIIRPEALARVGIFDPEFFLYYEEVDLCRRIQAAGYQIWYWPDVVVTHIGGESSRQLKTLEFSSTAAQVVLWRMRSTLLYYRKHHGLTVHLAFWMESLLYAVTIFRNGRSKSPERAERKRNFAALRQLLRQAWTDTNGGRISPPQPW